ncbi:helix-turn-helix transcriptional regulator [Sutcliffiella horikoshii]|uniref:Helix-turn-helix transcriptional regulator n=1 Tax=Sutcliffiella horikoshii TaxID=79883 RepID=A0A5D4T3U8_9BACI|nr:helix-turn-helix transcriptional regulator [Sutcliffiella horikoshii]TYS68836.1 helix-turn-helix transcriptional regulator [Sutcliffiella horikoshii]
MNKASFRLYGKPMKLLRITKGKKVKEVANALDVSLPFITNCENGVRQLTEENTKKFLDFIEVSEEEAKEFCKIVGQ